MGPIWLKMLWNVEKMYRENTNFFEKTKIFCPKCPKNVISSIFEPHRHHEIMRYSPISLWIRKICLRDTVNVYFKYNYCIQFQRKKGMNMHKRHFGHGKIQKKFTVKFFKKMSPEMGPKWLEMVWNVKKTYLENEFFCLKIFSKHDFWMISCIFEPHMHHKITRYSPISLWMRKICLRDTVNVYFKYNYCIQFQRKKGMNMHKRHFGHRHNPKKI